MVLMRPAWGVGRRPPVLFAQPTSDTSGDAAPPKKKPPTEPVLAAKKESLQVLVAEAIIAGDLAALKSLRISHIDVNRRLRLPGTVVPRPKYTTTEGPIQIQAPTMIMLAIICEQDTLLDYMLGNLSPDLSVRADGFTALHVAAMVRDYRPLRLLLQYQWTQEYVDIPVEQDGIETRQGWATTALHCAITNHRAANVYQLIVEFPPYRGACDDAPAYQPENIELPSASGSTPLYVAVHARDYDIVRILIAAGADPGLPSGSGKSAIDLARELCTEAGGAPGSVEARILEVLTTDQSVHDLELLKAEVAPELVAPVIPEEQPIEGPAALHSRAEALADEAVHVAKEGLDVGEQLDRILKLMTDIDGRLKGMEGTRMAPIETKTVAPAPTSLVPVTSATTGVCSRCGRTDAAECPTCHFYFCSSCGHKADLHKCAK
jgi:hypothetical protein